MRKQKILERILILPNWDALYPELAMMPTGVAMVRHFGGAKRRPKNANDHETTP